MKKQQNELKSNLTKAETLQYLEKHIVHSKIEKMLFFTINEWKNDKNSITKKIIQLFKTKKIIIRSSAIGEDSHEISEAGNYDSFQNIALHPTKIKNTVEKVIQSYEKKGNYNTKNQILIQIQTTDVKTSGVIFSRVPESSSPYYVIDYDDSDKTDSVTKGISSNVIKILRGSKEQEIPKKWISLIRSVKEIESVMKNNFLDIEFAITKNKIVIFQARPLTIAKKSNNLLDKKVVKEIRKNIKLYEKINKKTSNQLGTKIIFSDMADWNPSEIIGTNPNILDYSLYDFLIMTDIWHLGRKKIGYSKLNNSPLMQKFGSKPYVNLRASFNSMMPEKFPKKLKQKLLEYYFKKLGQYPEFHDKVEFEILFSCYDLSLRDRLKELKNFNFSQSEIEKIRHELLDFTNKIIYDFPSIVNWTNKSIQLLTERRKISKKYDKNDYKSCVNTIKNLLFDCKKHGTLPFSTMARIAFISNIILKSSEKQRILSKNDVENIMNSMETPLTKIQKDLKLLSEKKISQKYFLTLYGHLRPGTYDITAKRYDQNKEFYENIKYIKINKSKKFKIQKNKVDSIFKNEGLIFEQINFYEFLKQSLMLREFLKFEFTKNLSDVLEIIADLGKIFNFSRNEIANVNIKTILQLQNKSKTVAYLTLKKEIERNQKRKSINDKIILPPLLFSTNDFVKISYYISKPNFITHKKITGDSINLSNSFQGNELTNKIILIENADPGYDWIFSKNPLGLITKFGGVASHMAIRCNELRLPAAIGCGEVLYEQLHNATKLMLDCKNGQIIILEKEKEDMFSQEKKVLKSLGYIK